MALFAQAKSQDIMLPAPTWEHCREWLSAKDWKINVLSDYPQGDVKFTVRRGFERIELMGKSDLEVMLKAILEIKRRSAFDE